MREAARETAQVNRNRQRQSDDWEPGGFVDGEPAVTKEEGTRIEGLWGGDNPEGDGSNHGHIVTNDGLNAASVRYPHTKEYFFHNPDDKRRR